MEWKWKMILFRVIFKISPDTGWIEQWFNLAVHDDLMGQG